MNILVTGGAGYIGSHTCLELLQAGHKVTVVDNLVNSNEQSLKRVEILSGKKIRFEKVDLLDRPALRSIFLSDKFDAVIHFAGLKAVGESVSVPLRYYHNNITGTLILLEIMIEVGIKNLIFSSSATVYGDPQKLPISEEAPCDWQANPYGRTKRMIEQILSDVYIADRAWNIVLLRYFNPVGAHPSGQIGEDPNGIPNNLLPYVAQVAVGRLPEVNVFGNDYPTPDGTGVRDYIHVVDLALGHLRALDTLPDRPGLEVYNLGANRGYSVLQVISAFERACEKSIPYRFAARRPGDVAASYADASKANRVLHWRAERDIDVICEDTWRWQSNNPQGYQ